DSYDAAGRLATTTDALGRSIGYSYYDDNLPAAATLLSYHEPAGTTPATRDIVVGRNIYDLAGHRTQQWSAADRLTPITYDAAGRVASVTADPSGVAGHACASGGCADRKTVYSYDADGHVTRPDL